MTKVTARSISGLFVVAWLCFVLPEQCAAQAPEPEAINADVLLKGGLLILGDGTEPVRGDVAIVDNKIVAVGKFLVDEVKMSLDCTGLCVSPGFIDLHNHSDSGVLRDTTRSVMNYLTQGCTTIVTGNCGSGPVDVEKYYRQLDDKGVGINVAHLIPQGSLRREVIGSDNRDATDAELQSMKELVEKGMKAGAWGMSTGLIYVPSSFANRDELSEIGKVVGQHGGIYASHIRGEGTGLLGAVEEALEIGKQGGVPVHISHFKSSGKDSWGLVRTAVEMIEAAREQGQVVTADQYPYTASSTSLGATTMPSWARAGGQKETIKRLEDESPEGERVRKAIRHKLEVTDNGHRIQIASYSKRPAWAGMRLDEIAASEGITPFELVVQIEKSGGAGVVNHSISEEDVRFVMTLPWVATASDGSTRIPSSTVPHPRSYGTFPRKVGLYAHQEKVITLQHAVRSSSGLPADILGMKDRGYLKVGYMADVIVWDADKFIDAATFTEPHQYSHGLVHAYVNGTPVMLNSRPTGALAGLPLRHPE